MHRSIDRLTVRLTVGISLIVIVPLALSLFILSKQHYNQSVDGQRRAAELQSRILEATLRHQMVRKDLTLLPRILGEIGSQPEVQNAMILDHEGEIRISSHPGREGERIPQTSAACLVCHSKDPEERDRSALLHGDSSDVLRTVLPIENRQECYECHSPEERVVGIFILDISLAEQQAELQRAQARIIGGAAILALLILSGVGLLVRALILKRLSNLRQTARKIAGGKMDERAAVKGQDVIALLGNDFNVMADSVSQLISELQEQEAKLASVMNSLDDGLLVLDRESRVVASNHSFCRRIGIHPEALRGMRCGQPMNRRLPCCESNQECPAMRCIATGEVQRAVFHVEAPDGEVAKVEEVHASPVLDGNGQVTQVVELWRDITRRVQEEKRLAEIERLVSLGVLASGFSHEINTPLASVLTCAEGIVGRIDESDNQLSPENTSSVREYADTIQQQVLRCRKITEQFLRFSRGIPPSIEPIDLRQVVSQVVSLAAPTAREHGIEIAIEGEAAIPAVTANTEVVQHVILNLLINAIQSCQDQGGRVVIRILCGSDVRVEVEDTGGGIESSDREHLFQPFYSRKTTGTGMGLFLSRSFMRRFDGDVRLAHSEVGCGSCFQIIFQRADLSDQE